MVVEQRNGNVEETALCNQEGYKGGYVTAAVGKQEKRPPGRIAER